MSPSVGHAPFSLSSGPHDGSDVPASAVPASVAAQMLRAPQV